MPLSEDEIRKVVKDELKRFQHNDLMDMPQQGHVNRDHDGRYHRKHANIYMDWGNKMMRGDYTLAPCIVSDTEPSNPFEGLMWVDTSGL